MAVSLYQRIAEDLVRKIASGVLPVGSVLPTELQLMTQFEASRNTIRAALRQLQDLGLVSRKRNRGTTVESKPAAGAFTQSLSTLDDLVSLASTATRKICSSSEIVMDIGTARELGCPPGSHWLHIAMSRSTAAAATPLAWTDAYVDPHYSAVKRLAARHPDRLLCDLIEVHHGRRIETVNQTVTPCTLDAEVTRRLQAPDGVPGLKIIRQYRDPAQSIVLVTRSYYPAGRYALTTVLVRNPR
jgi:GntR family transcriptional regulator